MEFPLLRNKRVLGQEYKHLPKVEPDAAEQKNKGYFTLRDSKRSFLSGEAFLRLTPQLQPSAEGGDGFCA